MSQLARRENAPHRAAFVTSLSRWYIRRLLGNLPPFHPCLSAERRPRIAPCGTSPPYGHTPRKSRHGKPFLPSSQCTRNWSRSSEELCQTIGDIFSGGVGGSSAALGVEQQDAMQRITGGIRTAPKKTDEVGDNTWGAYYVSATGRGCNVYRTGDNAWSYKDTVFDSARVVRTAEETRPLNRAVRYLIRAR